MERRWPARMSIRILAALTCAAASIPAAALAAQADESPIPTVHPKVFATAPTNASKPDDITILGDLLYVTYQNNAAADGTPAGSTSTVVAFDRNTGHVATTYALPGRCDGLTADPAHHRIFASVNEDLNSSLFVITPGSATPLAQYTYSPSPAQTGSDGTNGGTDAISIGPDGAVYVAHSNPDINLPAPNNAAAVYRLTLNGTNADLSPLFGVNDTAEVVNPPPTARTPRHSA